MLLFEGFSDHLNGLNLHYVPAVLSTFFPHFSHLCFQKWPVCIHPVLSWLDDIRL